MSRMQELVAEYNKLNPSKPVKKFSTVEAGEKRVAALKGGKPAKVAKVAEATKPGAKKSAAKKGKAPAAKHSSVRIDSDAKVTVIDRDNARMNEGSARAILFSRIKELGGKNVPLSKLSVDDKPVVAQLVRLGWAKYA